ncbi:sensory rhodopsin transducer [Mycobacterium sp. SMC-4]|uniref:sensory rhodopsin transducer n=1 Tax=Mycobacterium sp. SMC-4 TaxID=2857059 RepID=UPI0021B4D076|nr:sensory rhodopsin transducer [Mycobacterium sp. SMC-4]UXA18458.1 sensory rhodopsin transducer [Mycobacterium sp. SMC-4]
MTDPLGATVWVFPAGRIPPESTGREPEYTSRDELCILNTDSAPAQLAITVFHAERDPVGPYEVEVAGQRVRRIRVNDLIDPEAVPYDTPYGLVVRSDRPVTIQHLHLDSRRPEDSLFAAPGYPASS